jgi:hypothetical protein
MNALPGQMELATVIDHKPSKTSFGEHVACSEDGVLHWMSGRKFQNCELYTSPDTGVRLAKMLAQYDDSPSSQLWGDIQRLAREILK